MKINDRLKRLSSYIEDNSCLIDVGCDHALLGIYLVQNKKNITVIASDINGGPLETAKSNIDRYDLSNYIKIKRGDGLSTIEDDVDTIVISGMGGLNIVNILEDGKDKLNNIKRIVLSPNNFYKEVREKTQELGYKIICEEIILDKDKYYPIIVLEKGSITYNEKELLFGYNVIKNESLISYYDYLIETYKNILDSIPGDREDKRKEIEKYIDYLFEIKQRQV